jgi:hypothetical protein
MVAGGHPSSPRALLHWGVERFLILLAVPCGRIRLMGTSFSAPSGRQRYLSAQYNCTHQVVGYRKPQGHGPYLL